MAKYLLTKRAVQDIEEIWNYTFDEWSEKQADKYYNQILSFCTELSHEPQEGKKYFNLVKNLQGSRINKHIVFFRKISDDTIEIERILHQRMDLKSKFNK